ncbi:hypothetical protein ACFYOV_28750 [Streptomyces sp. NPDC005931]|uniref:hypothetical protein n=1 Tax=Streptomyces sp. NPDC005931 TaxID=3364737 RepID=UPI003681F020
MLTLGGCGQTGDCGGHCGCGDATDTPACTASERPRWFTGQLVGPADLESLQQWVIARGRRHNRMLHGWGVSCGLTVHPTTAPGGEDTVPWSVTIGAGYALSACGDEVTVPHPVRIDIREPAPSADDVCATPVDPWRAPVRRRRDPERTYYFAIRYAERHTRPVRAGGCGCGCDDEPCEYSRVHEGFLTAILDELPACYEDSGTGDRELDRREAVDCSHRIRATGTRPCPDCCSPWIVLADLRVDTLGTVTVDPLAHRRFLYAFGRTAFTCDDTGGGSDTVGPYGRNLTDVERDVLKSAFTAQAADRAAHAAPSDLLAAPAHTLRGATRTRPLRDLVGDRNVADLAATDLTALTTAAENLGADPAAAAHLHQLARLVTRLLT